MYSQEYEFVIIQKKEETNLTVDEENLIYQQKWNENWKIGYRVERMTIPNPLDIDGRQNHGRVWVRLNRQITNQRHPQLLIPASQKYFNKKYSMYIQLFIS